MRGSNAVNALNRFSQSENPRMNAELEDRAERAALATMRIVMKYYILFSYISVLMYVIFALSVTYFFLRNLPWFGNDCNRILFYLIIIINK